MTWFLHSKSAVEVHKDGSQNWGLFAHFYMAENSYLTGFLGMSFLPYTTFRLKRVKDTSYVWRSEFSRLYSSAKLVRTWFPEIGYLAPNDMGKYHGKS